MPAFWWASDELVVRQTPRVQSAPRCSYLAIGTANATHDHKLLLSLLGEHGRAEHPDPALLDAERAATELAEQRKAVSAADAAAKERRQHTMEQHAAELARRIEEMQRETEQEKAARIACDQDAARVKAEADDALSVAEQRLHKLLDMELFC